MGCYEVAAAFSSKGITRVTARSVGLTCVGGLQELIEDYLAHLERPGTPFKTFRIKVFVFMAAEEPLTPDEIMEGQTFFRCAE